MTENVTRAVFKVKNLKGQILNIAGHPTARKQKNRSKHFCWAG
jgi:hypothetical protein